MIKRYCDRCGQQIDEGVHAWYVLELHGTDGEFRHKELCEECYAYLCEKDEVPTADRKTEPQTDWETEKRDNSLCYKCVKECDRRVLNRYTIECNQYEPKDEQSGKE